MDWSLQGCYLFQAPPQANQGNICDLRNVVSSHSVQLQTSAALWSANSQLKTRAVLSSLSPSCLWSSRQSLDSKTQAKEKEHPGLRRRGVAHKRGVGKLRHHEQEDHGAREGLSIWRRGKKIGREVAKEVAEDNHMEGLDMEHDPLRNMSRTCQSHREPGFVDIQKSPFCRCNSSQQSCLCSFS